TPFLAEDIYRNLVVAPWGVSQPESVHLTEYPGSVPDFVDEALRARMALALEVVTLGRAARVEAGLRVRQPRREAVLGLANPSAEASLTDLLPLIKDELNVKQIRFAEDAEKYVVYQLKPNFKLLGPRLGPLVPKIKSALASASAEALRASLETKGTC